MRNSGYQKINILRQIVLFINRTFHTFVNNLEAMYPTLIIANRIDLSDYPSWVVPLVFFGPIVAGLIYLIYVQRNNSKWEQGIFPEKLKYNRDNLMEAYICLSALLIQNDRREVSEKMKYISSYFYRHFPDNDYNISDSLKWSFQNPIQPKTVSVWINKNIKDKAKRSQIIYFLVGLAMKDEQMIDREYRIIKDLSFSIGLTSSELESIIAMYRVKSNTNSNHSSSSSEKQLYKSKIEICLQILGLKTGSTLVEIKANYRKLVKIHHPDRFSNESAEQQKIASDRFRKIQEAYEFLEENYKN